MKKNCVEQNCELQRHCLYTYKMHTALKYKENAFLCVMTVIHNKHNIGSGWIFP